MSTLRDDNHRPKGGKSLNDQSHMQQLVPYYGNYESQRNVRNVTPTRPDDILTGPLDGNYEYGAATAFGNGHIIANSLDWALSSSSRQEYSITDVTLAEQQSINGGWVVLADMNAEKTLVGPRDSDGCGFIEADEDDEDDGVALFKGAEGGVSPTLTYTGNTVDAVDTAKTGSKPIPTPGRRRMRTIITDFGNEFTEFVTDDDISSSSTRPGTPQPVCELETNDGWFAFYGPAAW